jgi:hypothetical protein
MREIILLIVKEWSKARTVFTAMFFGALIYCILKGINIPDLLNTIVSTLLGYWYGQGKQGKPVEEQNGGTK